MNITSSKKHPVKQIGSSQSNFKTNIRQIKIKKKTIQLRNHAQTQNINS